MRLRLPLRWLSGVLVSAGIAFAGCGSDTTSGTPEVSEAGAGSESTTDGNAGGSQSGTAGTSGTVTGGAESGGGGLGTGGSSGSASVGGVAGTAGHASSTCPAAPPELGSPCSTNGSQCSFGDSPFPECRTYVACFSGKWTKGAGGSSCSPSATAACPPSTPTTGSACDAAEVGSRCSFSTGALCNCVKETCGGAGCTALPNPQWVCGQPMLSCPKQAPNAGSACGDEPMGCQYEYCGLTAMCQNGVWKWLFGCA